MSDDSNSAPPQVAPAFLESADAKAKPTPAPTKAAPPPIGLTAQKTPVYAPFQPTVASIAVALTPFMSSAAGIERALPLPTGFELIRSPDDKQTQLKVSEFFATKMRRCFGYVWGVSH